MSDSLPPIVERFLQRPGALFHGSFTYSTDDPDEWVALKRKVPAGHIAVNFDNWPQVPRVWYLGSEPHDVRPPALIKDVPYSLSEKAEAA